MSLPDSHEEVTAVLAQSGRLSPSSEIASPTASGIAVTKKEWRKDKNAKECMGCQQPFTAIKRKHHCRSCGNVFCASCTKHKEFLETKGGRIEEMRVCAECSASHAVDKEDPLYRVLGDVLGPVYFYPLRRAGFGDLTALMSLPGDQLHEIFEMIGVHEKHRISLSQRIIDAKLNSQISSGRRPLRSTSPPGSLGAQDGVDFAPISPTHRNSVFEFGSPVQRPDSPIHRMSVVDSSELGSSKKQIKAKWRAEMEQMENEQQRMQRRMAALEAGTMHQTQVLQSLKRQCDEQEQRCGTIEQLQQELNRYRELERIEASEAQWKEKAMEQAVPKVQQEVQKRKQAFREGRHHSKTCQICLVPFSFLLREHHCRVCYRAVCVECCRGRVQGHRMCDWCTVDAVLKSPDWKRETKQSREFRILAASTLSAVVSELNLMDGSRPTNSCGPAPKLAGSSSASPSVSNFGESSLSEDMSRTRAKSALDRVVENAYVNANRRGAPAGETSL